MQVNEVIDRLKKLVMVLKKEGGWKQSFYSWGKEHVDQLNKLFGYHPVDGMPPIYQLVKMDFHPTEPLVVFDYTKLAHTKLHLYENGWTDVIRQCRGAVFDSFGETVALPWPKFFNFDGKASHVPRGTFTATMKYDGHLGIIFQYRERLFVTTRGNFSSPTAVIATSMMERYIEEFQWRWSEIAGMTLMVEIIHPETKIHLDYAEEKFVLLGARWLDTGRDRSNSEVANLSERLGIPLAERWEGSSIHDLIKLIRDPNQTGEGYVVRFEDGSRLKFKCAGYVQWMVRKSMGKNPYAYVVRRILDGDLKEKIPHLDEESVNFARTFVQRVQRINRLALSQKDRWRKMYTLPPREFCTNGYKEACRELAKTRPDPS